MKTAEDRAREHLDRWSMDSNADIDASMAAALREHEADVREVCAAEDVEGIRAELLKVRADREQAWDDVRVLRIQVNELDRARDEAAAWRARAEALYALASGAWMSTTILGDVRVERADAKLRALGIDPNAPEAT